uniref:Cadherin domain-containing protein n=1 Tax=Sinocyclocheilus grahami TaxID=75366 RepID=A0A672SNZ3_SINGR
YCYSSPLHVLLSEMHLEIGESALPGTRFQLEAARDSDSGSNSVHHYKLSHNDNFRLEIKDRGEDGKIPILILQKPLDREFIRNIKLQLIAVDGGKPAKSGTMEITINVLDINDNVPVFTKDVYSVMLNENAPIGTTVIQVNATDLDEGPNGDIVYSFGKSVNSKARKLFDINTATGEITVKGLLDYEDKDSYEIDIQASGKGLIPMITDQMALINRETKFQYYITLTAKDLGQPSLSSLKTITVLISDVNDNIWAQIRYSISEEQKDGAAVGNIAKDLGIDHRTLKERGFRIVSTSGESMFSVNQHDGVLYVNGKIDREEVCERSTPCLINLKIALENPLEIHYVTVEILDVNDHSPMFSENEKRLEIWESALPGARYPLQAAHDPDSGSNSVQTYKLGHNDHFRLEIKDREEDGKIPILILHKPLDREVTKNLKLELTAFDGGRPPKSGSIEIFIDVLDINDNVPVFTKDAYTVTLNENAPVGTTVVKVNATDLDEGQNGEVVYALGNNVKNNLRRLFEVNEITGEIILRDRLDFEVKDKYEIDIQASDKGTVPLATDKSVIIKIVDVNDNAPEIEVTSFSSAIPEDSKTGTTVALISVTDLDSGLNGKISCSLSEDIPFKLMPSSQVNIYSLVTSGLLDRETKFQYHITLSAKDMGQPSLSSVKTITVLISDVNDNTPEFSFSPYAFYVMENNVPGKFLFSVSATDKDANENAIVSYQTWRGSIVATDSGTPSLSSNVTVNVTILFMPCPPDCFSKCVLRAYCLILSYAVGLGSWVFFRIALPLSFPFTHSFS